MRDVVKAGHPGPRVFRYVVRYDAGTAPRPYGGICSLAICKPRIRSVAEVGDWIIGFRSRSPGEVLYVMRVCERLTLGGYWQDSRFSDRKPGASKVPDNLYRPIRAGGLRQVPNAVHGPGEAAKDIRGRNVLLSDHYWYFGSNSVPLPNELLHLVHSTQGHSVNAARRTDDVARMEAWLATWRIGIHGPPIDAAFNGVAAVSRARARPRGRTHPRADPGELACREPVRRRRC